VLDVMAAFEEASTASRHVAITSGLPRVEALPAD
jgi:hypothetical protein